MIWIAAAIVLLTALTVLNLMLSVGVVRRLREHAAAILELQTTGGPRGTSPFAEIGSNVDDFEVYTTDGETLTRDGLLTTTAVGFFSPTCNLCQEVYEQFAQFALESVRDRTRVLTVLIGEPNETEDMAAGISRVSRVVLEPYNGHLLTAFRSDGIPAVYTVGHGGRVFSAAPSMLALRNWEVHDAATV